ncbi:MAG: hypothetical protein ABI220_03625 [Candidatus Saccharimonadales bacterium]
MSERNFIYPNHPNFVPFLELAQSTEMISNRGVVTYRHADVPLALTPSAYIDLEMLQYLDPTARKRVEARQNNQNEINEDFWYRYGGLDTLSPRKMWPDGYVNNGFRVQRQMSWSDTPTAQEIITYGVGTLRPQKPQHNGMRSFLAEAARRVDSRRRQTFATYIVNIDHHNGVEWTGRPYALESTNLVMPETLGELRQLADRRQELDFIRDYLADLQATVKPVAIPIYTDGVTDVDTGDKSPVPQSIADRQWRWREAHRAHIGAGLWTTPPVDNVELTDRVDQLLEKTIIDYNPIEQTFQEEPSPELLALQAKYPGCI